MSQLEFWFEFGSIYSYPAAMRLEEMTRAYGCAELALEQRTDRPWALSCSSESDWSALDAIRLAEGKAA